MDTFSVASGQTSNHLKWSNLDLFFARPPRGGPEKFLFLYRTICIERNRSAMD